MGKDDSSTIDISWEEIQKNIDNNDSYKIFLEQIPISIYKIAASKKDKPKVVKAIMKVLQKNDPTNASEDYAQKIANRMQKLAQSILEKQT